MTNLEPQTPQTRRPLKMYRLNFTDLVLATVRRLVASQTAKK